jgi:hypothetical protein
MPDIILEGDHPRIISAKLGRDWLSSYRGEDFIERFSSKNMSGSSALRPRWPPQPNLT